MIIHSIKWRLQAWHGFLLVCLVSGLMTGFYFFERRVRLEAVDRQLLEAMTPLLPRFAPPVRREPLERGPRDRGPGDFPPEDRNRLRPPREDGEPSFERRPIREEFSTPRELPAQLDLGKIFYVVWDGRGERIAESANTPSELERPRSRGRDGGQILRKRDDYRELINFVPSGRCVLVGTSLAPTLTELRHLAVALAVLGCGIVVAGLAVGWWLATRALQPISEIGQTAQEIAGGDLSKRINASETESELGQLATVLNSTFARLETAFAQQQQFTSDAAHELRTPVAVMLTQIQSTLNRERSGAEYRETLEACQRAAQRMRRLIESLLELARFDAGQEKIKRLPFDLATTAAECAELLQPLAVERGVRIVTDLSSARCNGDPERIGQVITNLLTNAVNYNQADGEARLSVSAENGAAIVTVSDTGRGIAPEDLPRVFERFYRGDKSRTNSLGGAGLGLSICKAIVEAHGGTISVQSEIGSGTTFTMRLPA